MHPSCLLSLAHLHAAAPGVLDVIFGSDGDFEGAPTSSMVICARERWWTVAAFVGDEDQVGGALLISADGAWPPDYESVPLAWCALDLRVLSVAARLAGLCARAAQGSGDSIATITRTSIIRTAIDDVRYGQIQRGTAKALAALTLAPRIAVLRKP